MIIALWPLVTHAQSIPACRKTHERYPNLADSAVKTVAPFYPNDPGFRVRGRVIVKVEVNKSGDVVSARAICGQPMLLAWSLTAAKNWKFKPRKLKGKPVKTIGIIIFDFPSKSDSTGANSYINAASNNSLNRSGMSLPLIENLSHDAVVSRPVNSGVRRLIFPPRELNIQRAWSVNSKGLQNERRAKLAGPLFCTCPRIYRPSLQTPLIGLYLSSCGSNDVLRRSLIFFFTLTAHPFYPRSLDTARGCRSSTGQSAHRTADSKNNQPARGSCPHRLPTATA